MVIELPSDFREFLQLLNEHEVRFLLIGGFAVAFHRYPRATQDIEIWFENSPTNAKRVVAAIRAFGFDVPKLNAELIQQPRKILRMGHPPMRIEMMNEIDGVAFEQCYQNSITSNVDGVSLRIISLADPKQNKQASARHKDLDDLEHLP